MNKAIIFDLDGTLIHSLEDIKDSLNVTLARYGHPLVDDCEAKKNIGNGARRLVKDSIKEKLTDAEIDERLAFYNDVYTQSGSPKTRLFDGVNKLLSTLKSKGYKLAILTNKPQATTDEVYKKYLSHYEFDCVIGQSSAFEKKPAPDGAIEIMKRLGVLPENTFFVGDGETDVLTAINSLTKGIAVLWGYRSKEQLIEAGAKTFVSTPEELADIL